MRLNPRAIAARSLALLRTQEPYVIWGNEPMNGGNYLYLWATAWARHRTTGTRWQVRYKPKMAPWLQEFPGLAALTVREEDVGFRQPRSVEWGQRPQVDFLLPDLKEFCREVLLPGSDFCAREAQVMPEATVVNVRRGDYYSVPAHRRQYGMDIRGYVAAALAALPQEGTSRVVFVSDDVAWCREHLTDVVGPDREALTLPGEHDMFRDLAQLAFARNLILANSTFSYWGGYLASARPAPLRPRRVVAPLFFGRSYEYGESNLLLPEWLALPEDSWLPGPVI